MHCDREFVIIRQRERLLLVLGPPGFPGLFELPLRSCSAPATVTPSQVRLLFHRLRPCSKLIYVSRGNVVFRPKATLSPLSDGFAGLFHSLIICRVFYPLV